MENKKIGILGYGEVGQAIASFYDDPFIHDLNGMTIRDNVQLDVLHVCIPYTATTFVQSVQEAIAKWAGNAIVFIHSTVPVGTTETIGEYYKLVVHSPIRGIHPDLAQGIKTFIKYIGADDPGAARLAAEHLEEIGIEAMVLRKSSSTELLKLLDTSYYGLSIAYHAYAAGLCERVGVNFDMVMSDANRTYNEGYAKLGKSNVIRPVLYPPEANRIGGHCIVPNAELLRDQFGDDAILQAIIRHK